jgi:uncharacterized protein YybS (DUF2232 family)
MEVIVIAALMALYMFLGLYYLPVISIFYPIPFIVLGAKKGLRYNIIGLLSSCVLIGVLMDIYTGILVFAVFAPVSIFITYYIKQRKSANETILIAALISLISNLFAIELLGKVSGTSLMNQLEQMFSQILKAQIEMLKDTGMSSTEIYGAEDLLKNTFEYMTLIMPSIVIIISSILAYVDYLISVVILRKFGHGVFSVPQFSYFRLPNNVILGISTIFIGVFLLKIIKIFYYETIFINILVLLFFLFFIEGLAVVSFFIGKIRMGKLGKIIFIFLIILSLPLSIIVSTIGLLDVIFDFRKIKGRV